MDDEVDGDTCCLALVIVCMARDAHGTWICDVGSLTWSIAYVETYNLLSRDMS